MTKISEVIEYLNNVKKVFGDIESDINDYSFDFNIFESVTPEDVEILQWQVGECLSDIGVDSDNKFVEKFVIEKFPDYLEDYYKTDVILRGFEFLEHDVADNIDDEDERNKVLSDFINTDKSIKQSFWTNYIQTFSETDMSIVYDTSDAEYYAIKRINELKKAAGL